MVEKTNGRDTFRITASISGIIVLAGILISIGQILEDIDHQRTAYAELRMEIAQCRVELDRHASISAHRDAAKDMQFVLRRLDRMEQTLDKLENGK